MYTFLSIIIIIVSILLIATVLMQNSKGGGLTQNFASQQQIMGVRKTTDFLEKATWALAGFVLLGCILSTAFIPKAQVGERDSVIKEQVENAVAVDPNLTAPNFEDAE